jgi:hypothetical protein
LSNTNQSQSTSNPQTNSKYVNPEIEMFIQSDYVNIKEGESKTLEFIVTKTKLVDKLDFNGKPTKMVQFVVINSQDPQRTERKLELSRKHIAKIYNELKKGKTVIEIYRNGTGKETVYIPKSIR